MSNCRCPHHFVIGVFILVFGLVFLLQAMEVLSAAFVSYAWPVLVIAVGLHKLIAGMCACCGGKKMAKGKGMEMKDDKCCGSEGECGCGAGDKGCAGACGDHK